MTKLAAKLKYRFMLQKAVDTPNDQGTFTRTYKDIRKVWGNYEDLTNRQLWFHRQGSESGSSIRITLRPAQDIKIHYFLLLLSKTNPNRRFRIDSLLQPAPDQLIANCSEIEEILT